MKPLEALENIKREAGTPYFSSFYDIDDWKDDFHTIESALVALDILKKELNIKVVKYAPNDSETRLFVECGNFKASIFIPRAYAGLLDEVFRK